MDGGAALFQEHLLTPSTRDGAIWRYHPSYPKPCHFHGQLEFILLLRGRMVEYIGHRRHTVHAGQLIWHLPGVHHRAVESSSDLDFRVVQTEPDLTAELLPDLGFSPSADIVERGSFSSWAENLASMVAGRPVVEIGERDRDRILEECDLSSLEDPRIDHNPRRLRRALLGAWQATLANHDDRRPSSLVEIASSRLLEQPWLERSTLCRDLDVSEGFLSRSFKAELGISFLEQRSRIRTALFASLVVRQGCNMLDAALRSGFGSYSQLHRVFTQLVGINPRAYFLGGARNARANQTTLE